MHTIDLGHMWSTIVLRDALSLDDPDIDALGHSVAFP